MIDPILFSIDLGFTELIIRWYGLLVVGGVLAAAFYASWYVKREGEDPNLVWDALIWLLISGIIGARLWYVAADIIGGSQRYVENPMSILWINEGGLNILGGVVVGVIVGWIFAKRQQVDFWLLADAIAPGYLIGQAIGRWGNYINQELYGPPTTLPWGISIAPEHRMAPWSNLTDFPVDTTFFHPTFAYEMIWNLIFAGVLTYLIIRHSDTLKTGVIAGGALLATGIGRALIETNFRPDQPSFFGLGFSTSLVISILFALIGLFLMLVRMGKISVPFLQAGGDDYERKEMRRRPSVRKPRQKKA